jgi:hypothetical protein
MKWLSCAAKRQSPYVKGAIDHFKQFLIGSDAANISALWSERM